MTPIVESGAKLALVWLIGFPAVACLLSIIVAGPVAAVEECSFEDAFLFFLMGMTMTGIPLTTWVPTGTGGIIITLVFSIFYLLVFVLFVGVSAGPLADPFVDAFGLAPRATHTLFKHHALFYVCFFPALCLLVSITLGGILAAAEGWPFVDGFVLTLGECTNTRVTLPGTPPPDSVGGKVVGLFVGVVASAILGIFIAIGSVPLLGYELSFTDSPFTRSTTFLLNSEQKETLADVDEAGPADSGRAVVVPQIELQSAVSRV